MRAVWFGTSALLFLQVAAAHDVITTNLTYARDVSRIFARHCVSCHGAGSAIPLTNYQEVRPWAVGIKEQILSRSMPPWGAVKGFGNIVPDYGLSQEDMMIVAAWVVGGAPEGNSKLLPAADTGKGTAAPGRPGLKQALIVQTRTQLTKDMLIAGIRPLIQARVGSARVTARLPDGRIEPLIWFYGYDPKFPRDFAFRAPLSLPTGTVIESTAPLSFALESHLTSP